LNLFGALPIDAFVHEFIEPIGAVRACRRDKMAFRERELAEPMPPSA